MRKLLLVCLVVAGLIGVYSLPSMGAGKEAPADLVIKAPEGAAATQSPVNFSHKKHAAVDCKGCHHKLDKNANDYKCASKGCHDNFDPQDKTSDKSFYRAYHDAQSAKSCLGCHKKEKAAGKSSPVVCTQCHPKKGA